MNGFPLTNLVLFLLCYLPLAAPLYWVTRSHQSLTSSASNPELTPRQASFDRQPALLLVQSAHPWEHLTLIIDDETKLESNGLAQENEFNIECYERCNVLIHVKWPKETPETAIRIEIQPDFWESQAYTAWGYSKLHEAFTFQWNYE